ncbi:hypothetical protein R1sor_019763 [Riccia sorocarpa]|uniref:F-box protein At3g26010-like beta-propeller domain-containing protein n=1 Tax=Riccia sorocarpa TaxID=122646 RepID=A0ABD3IHL8_9MARC
MHEEEEEAVTRGEAEERGRGVGGISGGENGEGGDESNDSGTGDAESGELRGRRPAFRGSISLEQSDHGPDAVEQRAGASDGTNPRPSLDSQPLPSSIGLQVLDYREASTFNPTINRWVSVSPPPFPINLMFFPIASASGLLCFSSCVNGRTTLVVTNPITRRWRELPPMLRIQTYHMAGMVVNRESKVYKIVVVGIYGINDVYYPTTEEFNSDTNCWSITGDIPRGPLFPSRRTLLCNEILYSWCCDPPDGLVAYDMKQGTWSQIHAPMRHTLDSHMLIESHGQIYTVGGLRENSVTKSICIWELQKSELEWKEVDRMPEILCDEFLCGGKRFICIGLDGIVLLLVRGSDRLVLSYDLSKRVWRRLPGCPLSDHRLRYGLIDGIAYEPRLDATV